MKLYAFYPGGHGEASFFVMAESEQEARSIVNAKIKEAVDYMEDVRARKTWSEQEAIDRRRYLEMELIARSKGGVDGDYYTLEVFEPGQIATNENG